MRVQKRGIRNGKQRIVIIFSDKFQKWLSIPFSIADECINNIRKCKNVDEVNKILRFYGLSEIPPQEVYAVSLESHIHKFLQRKPKELDYDELYQELFLKGLELLNSPQVRILSEFQKWKYIKTCLHNHIKSLIRKEQEKELPLSDVVEAQEQLSFMESVISPYSNISKYPFYVKFIEPEMYAVSRDLLEKIMAWAETQDEGTKVFFEEYFNPSPEVLEYMERQVNKGTWKNRKFEPLFLAKVLTETGKWKYKDGRDKWLKIRRKMIRDLGLAF